MQPIEIVDDFFHGDDRTFCRQNRLLLHADDTLDQHVAPSIGLLRVDERHVGPVRRNGRKLLSGERARDAFDRPD